MTKEENHSGLAIRQRNLGGSRGFIANFGGRCDLFAFGGLHGSQFVPDGTCFGWRGSSGSHGGGDCMSWTLFNLSEVMSWC